MMNIQSLLRNRRINDTILNIYPDNMTDIKKKPAI